RLERLGHLALHCGLAGFGIDGDDGAVAGDAVKHAVGRPHVDAEKGAGAFDVGLGRHFAGRRVDDHDRLAVDEPDDPTCCLGAARTGAVSESTFSFPNMMSLPLKRSAYERKGVRADAGSYADERAGMQAGGKISYR